ncbi:hypothetical protein H2202_009293 [Exophiala xenobiotica]|nr:hypothetical protein H2202_009293 [Exophiala xenobiotica]KAK5199567.1 hypothetical protein LTR92_000107 [Exophiala xenobiotica]KAK5210735.1 hypothetical protein LTR41_003346 [Exophiala xenobiotica]KAK5224937.1 hypothetical protein LTR72_004719 [Exophiala xenobiotica]KAK5237190.1 hypothetical protein LTR47_001455 [Exophiala xenobiotica]
MSRTLEYPKTGRNTVVRRGHRGKYDLETIHTLINTSLILNVSFAPDTDEDFPVILPMIGVMGSFDNPSAGLDEPLDCYLHGYVSNRLNNLVRKAHDAGKPGLPLCLSATKVDGLLLALSGFNHSYNYRSACLFGYANIVTNPEEILYGMRIITDKVVRNRWDNTRLPPTKADIASTAILRVTIKTGSGKVKADPPSDDKADMENEEMRSSVWAGYIPVTENLGEPVPAVYNRVDAVPEYITQHRSDVNDESKQYSEELVHKVMDAQAQ